MDPPLSSDDRARGHIACDVLCQSVPSLWRNIAIWNDAKIVMALRDSFAGPQDPLVYMLCGLVPQPPQGTSVLGRLEHS